MRQLVLIGFMGAGKTTVGAQLATKMNTYQRDLDQLIEQRLGETIASYFDRVGEHQFRQFETQILQEYADQSAILSTGGGIVMQTINRQILKQSSAPVVYLRTQPEELLHRLKDDLDRPLLKQMDHAAFIKLWQYREPLYQEVADVTIETDQLTPTQIVSEIINQLEMRQQNNG